VNREQAEKTVEEVRGIVPAAWKVEACNTEIRPGKPERYKVVVEAAGMTLVVSPTRRVYVTIDNGPGVLESVAAQSWGDKSFDDFGAAFAALKTRTTARLQRVTCQFVAFKD